MHTLRARNVNDLLVQGLELLANEGQQSQTRAGPVIVTPFPVMSVYEQPCERVLFNPVRDANPFFHLMEGLWMLAGRNDASFLNRYITDFGVRFAESATGAQNWEQGGVIHDAYGYRWRHALGFDQLQSIANRLKVDSTDRQCVLQMWDSSPTYEEALLSEPRVYHGQSDLLGDWRTRPCNTHAYFRVRVENDTANEIGRKVLDMTILCRSNDVVWGAYGANAVHFSMLLEYMAGRIGVSVGKLYQFSNNYHGYVDVLDRMGDPMQMPDSDAYDSALVYHEPMATDWSKWDEDLKNFMWWHDNNLSDPSAAVNHLFIGSITNKWFITTACRVAIARALWIMKQKDLAMEAAQKIEAPDWRMACQQWMDRRINR